MKLSSVCGSIVAAAGLASATMWQNDQVRITNYANAAIDPSGYKSNYIHQMPRNFPTKDDVTASSSIGNRKETLTQF
jgi:hypothetical protein